MSIATITVLVLVFLFLGCAVYFGCAARQRIKVRVFNLENHTYIGQQLSIHKEEYTVQDFDMRGSFVVIKRNKDRQLFKIIKI